jgi:phage repressor protein C with HTH and peptisase S24 domain
MDIFEIRLANLRAAINELATKGLNKQESAGKLDMSASYLSQLLGGKNIGESTARKIEEALGLPRGSFDQVSAAPVSRFPAYAIRAVDGVDGVLDDKEVMVAVVDVELSAGSGSAVEFIETKYRLPYQMEWLRKVGVKDPDHVRLMAVRGDSMERTLFSGDKVLIHLQDTRIKSDAVYAILLDGEAKIKRLFNSIVGIRVVSDNPDKQRYPDELVAPDSLERLVVVGRAIHRQGSSGL